MFEKMKERKHRRQEEKEQQRKAEMERLMALSEKEVLIEVLMELKRIEDRLDYIATTSG